MKILNVITSVVLIGVAVLLGGCDVKNDPIPLKDSPLVGVWESERRIEENGLLRVQHMYVEFTGEGYVAFHRVNCWTEIAAENSRWSIKDFKIDFMPVIKLTKVKVKAQWMPFTPKIEMKLDSWPKDVNGVMTMTIDGMELTAKEVASDRSLWVCENMGEG